MAEPRRSQKTRWQKTLKMDKEILDIEGAATSSVSPKPPSTNSPGKEPSPPPVSAANGASLAPILLTGSRTAPSDQLAQALKAGRRRSS